MRIGGDTALALRTSISERQRRLGAELRRQRERSGRSLAEAAAAVGMSSSHLSHVEAGRTALTIDRLRALCRAYGLNHEPYVEALVAMAESSGRGWWSAYRRRQPQTALNLAELEAGADRLESQEPLCIPGLFQTEAYMHASFDMLGPGRGERDAADSAEFRLRRQQVLTGQRPPAVHLVIHEAALHVHVGTPEVMREQLVHLVELARLPHVVIQVFPYEAGVYAAHSGAFLLIRPTVEELGTVLLDHPVQPLYLDDPEHIARYAEMFRRLTELALPPIDPDTHPEHRTGKCSRGLVQHILYTL